MIYLITGASHTGKTNLAQKLLEKYKFPYLSIDHLKMGLIRSGNTSLTPLSEDNDLTSYLWPIVREIIKTAIENKQNLIVEGCYVPANWKDDFNEDYIKDVKYCCLIMSKEYIKNNFDKIKEHANIIESRLSDDLALEDVIKDNAERLELSKKYDLNYILIDKEYEFKI